MLIKIYPLKMYAYKNAYKKIHEVLCLGIEFSLAPVGKVSRSKHDGTRPLRFKPAVLISVSCPLARKCNGEGSFPISKVLVFEGNSYVC